jgi:rare lipoprotein A
VVLIAAPPNSAATTKADLLHGIASWYGGVFHGRRTASGERFDKNAMTACHPTLPFGTLVRVVNLNNRRSVVVRITDRGYLYEGRIIDLSYGAAQKLAMTEGGLAPVELEVLSLGQVSRKQ